MAKVRNIFAAVYIQYRGEVRFAHASISNILRRSDASGLLTTVTRRVIAINFVVFRVCKFFHCAANTLIFSGFEAKNVKASGAPPQAPMGELTAPPHTPLLVSGWAPPPAAPPTNRPPYSPIPRSATGNGALSLPYPSVVTY